MCKLHLSFADDDDDYGGVDAEGDDDDDDGDKDDDHDLHMLSLLTKILNLFWQKFPFYW